MVHNFTLVHDDIMDHDDLRRGRQTLHKRWDESTAILAGDGLLVLAYLALSRVKIPNPQQVWKKFSLGILKVCEGQALDKAYEQSDHLTLDDYLEMIDKKTAALFAMASEVGAIIGGGRDDQVTAMKQYGATLGRAFQIQDDLLDIVADEGELGKTIGSDLKEGKKTFLIVHALGCPDEELVRRLEERLKSNPITAEDVLAVKKLLVQTGTLKAARDEIEGALTRARETLQPIPDNAAKQHLIELLEIVASRRS
jgi:geranylgeranyl pyrophosphate synthase